MAYKPAYIWNGTSFDQIGNQAVASLNDYALLASPTFTGTPLAPTATTGTNTTQIATTAYVVDGLAAKTDLAMVQNSQVGTSYSYEITDSTRLLTMNNSASNTVLVTKQATVTWVNGTQLRIINLGLGTTTLVADTGVTINNNRSLAQYQGGTLIRTASDVWLFVPTASSSGMDLITPTSVAGSGVTLSGGQVTFTAATSISVNGCFTSAYANYRVALNAEGGVTIFSMRLRAAGTDTSADYVGSFVRFDGGASSTYYETAVTDRWKIGVARATVRSVFDALIISPQLSTYTGISGTGDDDNQAAIVGGQHKAATSFDGFTLIPASGTLTGTVRVYGLRNS